MIQTFLNWLKFDAQNMIAEVWWASLVLWLALMATGISDIAANTITRGAKAAWITAVVLLPLVGLFAYCIFSLTRADYHMLEFVFRKRKGSHRSGSKVSASTS